MIVCVFFFIENMAIKHSKDFDLIDVKLMTEVTIYRVKNTFKFMLVITI